MFVGHSHTLRVNRTTFDTVWLNAGELGEVPLALSSAPDCAVGDEIRVFILSDATGQPQAITEIPIAELGECACMTAVSSTGAGTFLDWGISKNLLMPFAEQRRPVETGQSEVVLVYLDNSGRLAASSRIDHHLSDTPAGFDNWQPVSLLVYQRTDLGFKAVIDNCAIGLLYKDEIFQTVKVGDRLPGFVKQVRSDGRIDLSLQPRANELKDELTETIIEYLQDNSGESTLTDKSPPEEIYATFKVSKKNYKKALGILYRQKRILIGKDKITLVSP